MAGVARAAEASPTIRFLTGDAVLARVNKIQACMRIFFLSLASTYPLPPFALFARHPHPLFPVLPRA